MFFIDGYFSRRRTADGADFDESEHKRDDKGRFSKGSAKTIAHDPVSLSGEKSRGQLKREHKARTLKEFYGEEIKGRGLSGRTAVKKLVEEQRGHIKAAFHRGDLGDIDLVWGDTEAGLCHIFYQRLNKKQDVQKVINSISNVIANGEIVHDKERPGSYFIQLGKTGVSVSKEFKGEKSARLVVTAYEQK